MKKRRKNYLGMKEKKKNKNVYLDIHNTKTDLNNIMFLVVDNSSVIIRQHSDDGLHARISK